MRFYLVRFLTSIEVSILPSDNKLIKSSPKLNLAATAVILHNGNHFSLDKILLKNILQQELGRSSFIIITFTAV